jgi:tetratricopeptide (TPR) repeat protein
LPPSARLLAEFVACIEDDDRESGIIEANWADLWQRLQRSGEPPDPAPLLEVLAAAALIQAESSRAAGDTDERTTEDAAVGSIRYRMHPGIAAAIYAAAAPEVHETADTELAVFWHDVAYQAEQRDGGEDTAMIVNAGLAAVPYLLRRRDWDTASTLLESAMQREQSPGVIQAVLPALRRIADATQAPKDQAILADALRTMDPAEAEGLLRDALHTAIGDGDYRLASPIAGDLVSMLRDTGRLRAALDLVTQMVGYTQQAGFGAWTQLADQGRRLEILGLIGEHEQVLAETATLRARMRELSAKLPSRRADSDPVNPWNVREAILDIGHTSALALGQWQQCLDLNAEITASKQRRSAGIHEITRTWVNDAWPLIRLGRLDEAGQLLRGCQQVFEDHADTPRLARVLGTRAALEDALGHLEAAAELARTALRLCYARLDPRDIATCHHNLGFYLRAAGTDPVGQRAHRLAAALIYQLTGMTYDLAGTERALAAELREDSGTAKLPTILAEVIQVAEQTDGVRLGELITALQPDQEVAEEALAQILRDAADLPADDAGDVAGHLEQWEPVISALAANSRGDRDAAAQLLQALDEAVKDPDWAALVAVLRRILDGERGGSLLDGLDPIDTAIARAALARISIPEPGTTARYE